MQDRRQRIDALGGGGGRGTANDASPYFGIVAYAAGPLGVDQPISIDRLKYVSRPDTLYAALAWNPFAISPLWDRRGRVLAAVTSDNVNAAGIGALNQFVTAPSGTRYYAALLWPDGWFAYDRPTLVRSGWMGSIVEDGEDKTGTYDRRNRAYDPKTGRFTQEDPIGLAGG